MSYIFSNNGSNRMFQQLNSMLVTMPDTGDNPSYGIIARTGGATPEYTWSADHFTLGIPFGITYNVTSGAQLVYNDIVSKRATGETTINWDPSRAIEPGTYYLRVKLRVYIENIDIIVQDASISDEHEHEHDDNTTDWERIMSNQYIFMVKLGSQTVLCEGVYDSLNSFQTYESTIITDITSATPVITVTTNMGKPFNVQLVNYSGVHGDIEFKVNCIQFTMMKLQLN